MSRAVCSLKSVNFIRFFTLLCLLFATYLALTNPVFAQNPTPVATEQPSNWPNKLSSPEILSIALGIVGAAGTVFGIVSWNSARKANKVQAYLFKVAEQNIQKDISETELAKKRADIEISAKQLEELRAQIRRDIPIEARRAVLLDRLNLQLEHLNQSHQAALETRRELETMGDHAEISVELLSAIESEIRPEYLIRERQAKLKTYLTITTTTAAILGSLFSTLFPSIRIQYVSIPFLIPALIILALMVKESLPKNGFRLLIERAGKSQIIVFAIGIGFLVVGLVILIFLRELSWSWNVGREELIAGSVLTMLMGITYIILSVVKYRQKRGSSHNADLGLAGKQENDVGN